MAVVRCLCKASQFFDTFNKNTCSKLIFQCCYMYLLAISCTKDSLNQTLSKNRTGIFLLRTNQVNSQYNYLELIIIILPFKIVSVLISKDMKPTASALVQKRFFAYSLCRIHVCRVQFSL